jgi:peptidoglycan/xylan/chitin deacetylase (PgdA/CDA1 family)/GT2 family glycosyltransferase
MNPAPGAGPEITVVIPTHNRRDRLRALLESLALQTLAPERFEVVVAVDGSTDGTEQMLEELSTPYRLTAVALARGGAGRARNRGVEPASGRFLLFLDDDMVADPKLVAEHLDAQQREGGVIGLGTVPLLPRPKPSRWARWRNERRRQYFGALAAGYPLTFMNCWGGNISLPRDLFLATGGFAESFPAPGMEFGFPGHDVELGFRLSQHGARLLFVENAIAFEDDRETLRYALRSAEQRGGAELVLYELHPAMLPDLEIGGRSEPGWREIALHRILLATRIPPLLIAAVAALVPGDRRSLNAYTTLYGYCRLRGVRRAAPDRETWRRLRRGTTILMYHAIGRPGEPEGRFMISVRRFRRQLAWLRRRGYRVISLDELVRCRREFRLPPAKSVVITFDDGYTDTLELGLPLLERLGFPWTLFLPSAAGARSSWDGNIGRELIGLDQASAFLERMSVGAHTRTHVDLPTVGLEEARGEIVGSKADLEAALGVPVTLFAYPYGKHDDEIRRLVREAGFVAACGITHGPNQPATDSYELRRYEVYGTDSLVRFALMIWLGDIDRLLPRRG